MTKKIMDIPPTYQLSRKITQTLSEIEKYKTRLELLPIEQTKEKYSRQKSLLKSSLYSARIEGNPQTMEILEQSGWADSKLKEKMEVTNLYQALELVLSKKWQADITTDDLKKIHNLVMKNISPEAGFLRIEPSAIYNSAGIAVYVCPLPNEIRPLISQLLLYVNQEFETLIPIKAALSHIIFEKIHPFLDGNGRVGRLLIHLILQKFAYDFCGLVPIEEYFDNHRQTYYDLLSENKSDRTEFVEFFLEGLLQSAKTAVEEREKDGIIIDGKEQMLPPRRFEILNIVRDHKVVSIDFIKRRFMSIPDRTLRYDLHCLVKDGYLLKRGVTRSVVYEIKD